MSFAEAYERYRRHTPKSQEPIRIDVPTLYHKGELNIKQSGISDTPELLHETFAFHGKYGTMLRGKDLVIPTRYIGQLKYGGVIAPSLDRHLMIYGSDHWRRMLRLLGSQVGLDPAKNDLVRHVVGRHMEFSRLNYDDTLTLTDELLRYAGIKEDGEVVWVGMIYFAEIHAGNEAQFKNENYLTPEAVRSIFNLVKA